ncbi:MAG: AMP-binding protein, partial [Gammaproteobacteria bacterium]
TCGRVAEDRYEVRIVDEYDREVADGVPGEALVRPKVPWIMSNGYWQHPEWTEKAWRNLWHHTGDMLMRDGDGNLYFVDRVKDAIRRRGENISSMEVENEINSHPAVLECAVIPVSAEETEEEVMAVLVARDGDRVDPEELIRYLEPRMAYFMIPRYIEIVDALPKTATGKIQKFELRQAGVSERTWDRVAAGVKLER